MPRNVRNFWLIANVDGRATPIETGPRAAGGGFELVVLMREEGVVSEQRLYVRGSATSDGHLHLEVSADGRDRRPMLHTTAKGVTFTLHTTR